MILGRVTFCVLGVLLAGMAVPSLAATPGERAATKPAAAPATPAERGNAQASHSRRVELPFLLDSSPPEREPQAPPPVPESGPHPFRESLLKRAALADPGFPAEIRAGRLSRQSEFG